MKATADMICRYLQVWDPIGVTQSTVEYGLPLTEYDGYAGPLYTLLTEGATEEDIYNYLLEILEHMGIQADESRERKFAKSLHTYFTKSSGFRK